ncbi:helix-turn-helix domain-containing protein [Paenibacillus solisilvae]|uniref:Helix-turn-helix domain-containing protein n=1 Tax=Paenibacillus solisilvae TaxID=2486751 RepID=A0ABW0VZV8_9BACL
MSVPYSNEKQALIYPTAFHPYLLFAQKYEFFPGEYTFDRIGYMNAIIIVEAGEGGLHMDGQDFLMKEGSLVYIPAGKVHRWWTGLISPLVYRTAYFDWTPRQRPFKSQSEFFHVPSRTSSLQEAYVDEAPAMRIESVLQVTNLPLWLSYHNRFLTVPGRIGGSDMEDAIRIRGEFQVFLSFFLSNTSKDSSSNADPRIRELLKIVSNRADFDEQELFRCAAEIGLKRSRFYTLFRKETGFSPKHYMAHRRLNRIQCDLKQSNLSITEIAEKYGYSSIHVLSKNFRKHIGLTPSEYRRLNRM